MNIKEFRQQYPQYDDMSDSDLTAALHARHYSDIPKAEFDKQFIGKLDHDNLETAAVTAADSLELQKADPEVKPVIVGTNQEILNLKRAGKIGRDKILFLAVPGKAYVIDPKAVQGVYGASLAGSLKMAKMDILKGNDAHLLGYPEKGPNDIAVTKQGDILTELPKITDAAKSGNVAFAAQSDGKDGIDKALDVSTAIKTKSPRKWKTIGGGQLKPAVMLDGRKLMGGQTHDEILDYHGRDKDEGERGFTDPAGNFLGRQQGMQYLSEHQPDIHAQLQADGVDELHSEHLIKAYS